MQFLFITSGHSVYEMQRKDKPIAMRQLKFDYDMSKIKENL